MRIGFLAMSGVRAHDPELLRLGLTLPGFVERSKVVASLPSLGLLYLAAVTPAQHELIYCEAVDTKADLSALLTCELVAISTFSAQIYEAYEIAGRLREAGVKVAMGGLHVSVLPYEALAYADHVIVGEGENVWPSVVAAVEKGENGRLWRADDFPAVDIRLLPVPRYDLLAHREYNRFTVQTSRGCPWRCEFCASSVMLGKPYRRRPIDSIIRDIESLKRIRPEPYIEFADDNTFVDKRWGKELCRALIPHKLKWFTETDISVGDDLELLKLMREAGCRQVLIGLESPQAEELRGLELNNDFKAKRAGRYLEALKRIQSYGITVNGCFILGLDHHAEDVFESVRIFSEKSALYDVQITVLTPFPGTPLYARLLKEERILKSGAWELCTLFDVNFKPKRMSSERLRSGLHWLSTELYNKEAVTRRRRKFFANLRGSRANLGLNLEQENLAA